jgi:hypothetical protein
MCTPSAHFFYGANGYLVVCNVDSGGKDYFELLLLNVLYSMIVEK